ncbi:MAG: M55 family metallopeptidase [Defluviitaleaceae bacterium]|nr:M55 family metallopeptidase [Defluviitaleaceae bacterium]
MMTNALILADIEGIIGVNETFGDNAGELFTQEVELCINVLLENGIHKITVCDAHNKGDMILPRITEGRDNVKLVSQVRSVCFAEKYDFAIMVGYHGMEGSPGIWPHTYRYDIKQTSIFDKRLGKNIPIGEVEIGARWLGFHGVPVIFVSGDREAAYEANQFNPYRQASCIRTLLQTEEIKIEVLRDKLVQDLKSSLKLDWDLCLSCDNSPILVEFYHSETADALVAKGYTKFINVDGSEGITFKSCSELVSEIHHIAGLLNQIGFEVETANIAFLKEVRELAKNLDKDAVANSEAGPLLSTSLTLLDKVARDKVMVILRSMVNGSV